MDIIIQEDMPTTISLRDANMNLLGRINIFNHGGGKYAVDVIARPQHLSQYLVQSWDNGDRVFRQRVVGGLISISIDPAEQGDPPPLMGDKE